MATLQMLGDKKILLLHIISAVKEIRQQSVWCYNARSCQNPKPSDIDSTLLFTFDLDEVKVLHANDAQFLCSAKAGPQIEWLLSDYQSCRLLIWEFLELDYCTSATFPSFSRSSCIQNIVPLHLRLRHLGVFKLLANTNVICCWFYPCTWICLRVSWIPAFRQQTHQTFSSSEVDHLIELKQNMFAFSKWLSNAIYQIILLSSRFWKIFVQFALEWINNSFQ
jgi:hypothetical protein